MCFSVQASFGASAVLGTMGVIALRKTSHPKQLLFAAIPVFFSLQQFSEGLVWLSLTKAGSAVFGNMPAYLFLTFALLIWPVWLPLSIWLLEVQAKAKRLLLIPVIFGFLFSLLLSFLLFSNSVSPEIRGHHIHYELGFKEGLFKGASLLYFIPTILPPFLSSWKKVRLLGVFLFISYLVSKVYFADSVASVWCFLAAFISFIGLLVLSEIREKEAGLALPV
jgi:hypothetical protein